MAPNRKHQPDRPGKKQSDLAAEVLASCLRAGLDAYLLETPLVLAVSGGADSLSMLYLLHELRGEQAASTLHVAHLDHGFRGAEAEEDARFVARTAESLGLPVTTAKFDVPAFAKQRGLSAEDAARRVRYNFLAGVCKQHGSAVAVAHTADDQAETVLLHLLRGAGIGGLAGMKMLSTLPVEADCGEGPNERTEQALLTLFRPLLSVPRKDMDLFCEKRGLSPRVDSTNQMVDYRRNLIRNRIIPALEAVNRGVKNNLVRLSETARADDELLDTQARDAFEHVAHTQGTHAFVFRVADFAALPRALQRRVIRLAIERLAGSTQDFDMAHVETVVQVLGALPGPSSVDLPMGLSARRVGDNGLIYVREAASAFSLAEPATASEWPTLQPGTVLKLSPPAELTLDAGWRVSSRIEDRGNGALEAGEYEAVFDLDALPGTDLIIRTRRPGDYVRPLGLGGRKRLQDLFVDAKIPGALRSRVAIITATEDSAEVLWVPGPGGRRSAIAPVHEATRRVLRVQFTPGS